MVKKLRIAILAQAAWVLCGAVYLAVTPTRASARDCMNGHCISAYDCTYASGMYCNMGPNWCASTDCLPKPK
jgi:hypothetical protein